MMPELPEVETIRTQLIAALPLRIRSVRYSTVASSILKIRRFSLQRRTIRDIERTGKMLDFVLDDDAHMLSQLGMSGGWRLSERPIKEKHAHLHLGCDHGICLAYVDPRRFGRIELVYGPEARERLSRLGVDVSGADFTAAYIYQTLQAHPGRPLKVLLLDQKYFAGVGNYIASELCARAGVLPDRLCGEISLLECERLRAGCESVLTHSIKRKGLTFSDGYSDTTGSAGGGLQDLVVFHQQVCGLCGATVIRTVLGGRATFHCSRCQS